MYDTIWDYGDLPFKGQSANPIQIDTWVQVQSVNESEYIGENNFNSPKLDILDFVFLINLILFASKRRLE